MNNRKFLIVVFWLTIQIGLAQEEIVYQAAYLTSSGDTIKLDLYSNGKVKVVNVTPIANIDSIYADLYDNEDFYMYGEFAISKGDGFFGYIVNTYSLETSTLLSQSILPFSTTPELIQFEWQGILFFKLGGKGDILYLGTSEQTILGKRRKVYEFLLMYEGVFQRTQINLLIDANTKLPLHRRRLSFRKLFHGKQLILNKGKTDSFDIIFEKKIR